MIFAAVCALVGLALAPVLAALVVYGPLYKTDERPGLGVAARRGYPVQVGVVTAVAMAAVGAVWGAHWPVLVPLILVPSMVVASAIDLEHYRLPDRITFPTLALLVVGAVVVVASGDPGSRLMHGGYGAVGFSGFLLVFNLISPAGMGFGDVKYALALGFALGFADLSLVLYGILFGSLLGSVVGITVAVVRRTSKAAFPYGPSLCGGTLIALLLVDRLAR
ncbi:MAG: prepilin peptidase [Acidimicrobiia bacterium]